MSDENVSACEPTDERLPTVTLLGIQIVAADSPAAKMLDLPENLEQTVSILDFVEFQFPVDAQKTIEQGQSDGLPAWIIARTKSGAQVVFLGGARFPDGSRDWHLVYSLATAFNKDGSGKPTASADALTRLFSNLSHEMMTPLNAIIGFSEIICGQHFGAVPSRYQDYAQDITSSARYLLAMIKSALELGRLGSGKESLSETPCDLKAIIKSAMGMLAGAASKKNLRIHLEKLDACPTLYLDETKILQVFTNIISNSVKYSKRNSEITVRYVGESEEFLTFQISDDGIGMTGEDLKTAMMPFGRAEYTFNAAEPGTGLGIPIASAIVESHGGKLIIESDPAKGTVVSIMLPSDRALTDVGGGLSELLPS